MKKIPALKIKILFISIVSLIGITLIGFPIQTNAQVMINGGGGGGSYDSGDIYGGGGGVQGEVDVDGPMGNRFITWFPHDDDSDNGPSGGTIGSGPSGPGPGPTPPPGPDPTPDPCPSDGWFTTNTYNCSVCDGNDICTTCKKQEYRDYPNLGPDCSYSVTNKRTVHEDCSAHCTDGNCNCGEDAPSCPADCNEPPYSEGYDVEISGDFCEASKGEIVINYIPKWTFKDDTDDYDDTMQAYKIQLRDESGNTGQWKIDGLNAADGETVTRPLEVRTDDRLTSDPDDALHLEYNQDYDWHVDVQDSIGAWSGWSSPWQSFSVKPRYPKAQFSLSPQEPVINEEVTFDASDSEAYDGSQAKLSWDFDGDGSWEITDTTSKTTTHSYSETGEYTVILRVNDNSPKTSACFEEKEIKVKPKQGPRKEVIPRQKHRWLTDRKLMAH